MSARSKNDKRKIILLLLLIVILIIGGVLFIDIFSKFIGVQLNIPIFNRFKEATLKNSLKRSENIYLLEREELSKKEEKIRLMEEIVNNKTQELKSKEIEVNRLYEAIKEKEKELNRKAELVENKDREYQDRSKNIREQAIKLYNMPPKDASILLEQLPETDIVDILRAIDKYSDEIGSSSTSPYLLKLIKDINKTKAANVLAKLKFEGGANYQGVDILEDQNIEVPPAP